jgi:lipopolysaccharide/colanic/teichoic acid biosynthesis glycosyltransferase
MSALSPERAPCEGETGGSPHVGQPGQPHLPASIRTSTASNGREWSLLVAGLMASDLLSVLLSAALAGLVRYEDADLSWVRHGPQGQAVLLVLYVGLFWLLGWGAGIYNRDNLLGGPREYERVFRTGIYWGVATEMSAFILALPRTPRAWWFGVLVCTVLVACLARFTIRRLAYRLRRCGLFVTRVVVAGANDQGVDIARQLLWSGAYDIAGFVDDYASVGTRLVMAAPGDPRDVQKRWSTDRVVAVLGSSEQLYQVAADLGAREAVVIPESISWDGLQAIVAGHAMVSERVKIHMSTGVYDLFTSSMSLTQRGMVPLLTLDTKRLTGLDGLLKSTFDRVLAGVLLIVLVPTGVMLAGAARLRGMRPVLEWREVVGVEGTLVRVPLFHRLVTDRLLLRGIPALMRVVTGQLSLVGPRPIEREQAAKYGRWEPLLMAMRPGLTGYWRLLPKGATLDETAAWDLWYLRNYSIWTDLYLLFQTARAVVAPRGSLRRDLRRWEEAASSDRADHLVGISEL